MSDNLTLTTLYGRNYSSVGDIFVRVAVEEKVVSGMSVGAVSKPNEDALGIAQLNNKLLLAIADGHWGQEASELAIEKSLEVLKSSFRPPRGNEMRGRLYTLFDQINSLLLNIAMEAPGSPTPETSLIVCYLDIDQEVSRLYWASFGDSYLFVKQTDEEIRQLNTLRSSWLGALSKMAETTGRAGISLNYPTGGTSCYISVANGLETGILELSSGDILLLCTDGLIEAEPHEKHLTETGLENLLSGSNSLKKTVETLIKSALERNGKDNISCILAEI